MVAAFPTQRRHCRLRARPLGKGRQSVSTYTRTLLLCEDTECLKQFDAKLQDQEASQLQAHLHGRNETSVQSEFCFSNANVWLLSGKQNGVFFLVLLICRYIASIVRLLTQDFGTFGFACCTGAVYSVGQVVQGHFGRGCERTLLLVFRLQLCYPSICANYHVHVLTICENKKETHKF